MSEPAPAPSTLLVATSDATTRSLLRKALHVPAVEVMEAADGVEALALARRLHVDLVLLDAFLAVLDGISVCARIRALPAIEQPAIAIMGLSSERTVELAYSAGADEILTKPLLPNLIRQRVEVLLRRKRTEKRLRLLERAVEAAGTGFTVMDARSSEYPLLYANPAFLAMTGWPREEILGENLRVLRGPDTDVAATTELRDALAEGRACRVLVKNYRKDQTPFWNDLAVSPIPDAAGRVTHYVAVQTDVTARVGAGDLAASQHLEALTAEQTRMLEGVLAKVEERRRFTETILNGMIAGLVTTTPQGNISFANRAALRTLGVSMADCVGRPLLEMFGGNEELREVIEGRSERPEARLDFPLISPGGVRLYVGMSVMRVPEELRREFGHVILFRDLAETLERESEDSLGLPSPLDTPGIGPGAITPTPEGSLQTSGDDASVLPRHRPDGGAKPCVPADLIEQALARLEHEEPGSRPGTIDVAPDLPAVLADADQVVVALARLLQNAAHRAGRPDAVHLKVFETRAVGEFGHRPAPFVRVDILFPREEMTEDDISADPESDRHRQLRRMDIATAEQLLQANGGRLAQQLGDEDQRLLSAFLPIVPAAPAEESV
ncbi:MAG TPA: PAS domain-containing protein [Vicinamibacteria bacterium]